MSWIFFLYLGNERAWSQWEDWKHFLGWFPLLSSRLQSHPCGPAFPLAMCKILSEAGSPVHHQIHPHRCKIRKSKGMDVEKKRKTKSKHQGFPFVCPPSIDQLGQKASITLLGPSLRTWSHNSAQVFSDELILDLLMNITVDLFLTAHSTGQCLK